MPFFNLRDRNMPPHLLRDMQRNELCGTVSVGKMPGTQVSVSKGTRSMKFIQEYTPVPNNCVAYLHRQGTVQRDQGNAQAIHSTCKFPLSTPLLLPAPSCSHAHPALTSEDTGGSSQPGRRKAAPFPAAPGRGWARSSRWASALGWRMHSESPWGWCPSQTAHHSRHIDWTKEGPSGNG